MFDKKSAYFDFFNQVLLKISKNREKFRFNSDNLTSILGQIFKIRCMKLVPILGEVFINTMYISLIKKSGIKTDISECFDQINDVFENNESIKHEIDNVHDLVDESFFHCIYENYILPVRYIEQNSLSKTNPNEINHEDVISARKSFLRKESNLAKGTFYTPKQIAEFMTEISLNGYFENKIHLPKILDLCCGTGIFALSVVKYLDQKKIPPVDIVRCVYGFDCDHIALWILKIRLVLWFLTCKSTLLHKIMDKSILKPNVMDQTLQLKKELSQITNIINDNFKCIDIFSKSLQDRVKYDVILSNPPYIGEKNNKSMMDLAIRNTDFKKYYMPRMDYFLLFLGYAFENIADKGILGFIIPNYFTANDNAQKIRKFMYDFASSFQYYDFANIPLFKTARGHHSSIFFTKILKKEIQVEECTNLSSEDLRIFRYFTPQAGIKREDLLENNQDLKNNIEKFFVSKSMSFKHVFRKELKYQINFNFDEEKEQYFLKVFENCVSLKNFATIKQGVIAGPDRLNLRNKRFLPKSFCSPKNENGKNKGIFVINNDSDMITRLNHVEKGLLMPFLYPRDIDHKIYLNRSQVEKDAFNSIIYIDKYIKLDKNQYPSIHDHLFRYKSIMDVRRETKKNSIKWYQLHWPRKRELFEKPRIISIRMTKKPCFIYAKPSFVTDLCTNIITSDESMLPFIFFCLNNRIIIDWIKTNAKYKGKQMQIDSELLRNIPIPVIESIPNINPQNVDYSILEIMTDLLHNLYEKNPEKSSQLADDLITSLYESNWDKLKEYILKYMKIK